MSSAVRTNSAEPTTKDINDAIGKASSGAGDNRPSPFLLNHAQLSSALKACIKPTGGPSNGGLDNHMWAAVVDRMGVVRAVCYSGDTLGDQWPGSRRLRFGK